MPKLEEFLQKVPRNKEGDILLERRADEYGTTLEIAVPEDVFCSMFADAFQQSDVFEALKAADDIVDEIDLTSPSTENLPLSDAHIVRRIVNLAKRIADGKELTDALSKIRTETLEPIKLISKDGQKVRVVFRTRGYKKYFEKWKAEGLL